MLNEVKSASGGENTNNPQVGGEGQSLKSSAGMSPVVKGLVGILVLAGVGYGGWYLGQNQKSNVKNQNDFVQDKNVKIPINQPKSPSPTATSTPDGTSSGVSAKLDPTADWKTYENKDYGFSFKYPGDWKETNSSEGIVQIYSQSDQNAPSIPRELTSSETKIVVNQYTSNKSLDQYITDNPASETILSNQSVIVSGLKGEKITIKPEMGNKSTLVYFSKDSHIFEFYNYENDTNLDQILSTFKFTK